MDTELRHNIRRRWLFSLFEFAHLDFQRRLWIEADFPGIIGDYAEAVCQYFTDLNIEEGYDELLKQKIIEQPEYEIIADFHSQLDNYVDRPDKQTLAGKHILLDPEWKNLTGLAKTNWCKLKTVIADKDELEYMKKLEREYLKNKNTT